MECRLSSPIFGAMIGISKRSSSRRVYFAFFRPHREERRFEGVDGLTERRHPRTRSMNSATCFAEALYPKAWGIEAGCFESNLSNQAVLNPVVQLCRTERFRQEKRKDRKGSAFEIRVRRILPLESTGVPFRPLPLSLI